MNAPVDLDHRALAYSMPLDKMDVSDPRLYYDDVWQPYFERLRRDDPVHYTPESPYGPYWAVTKYRDIVQVEVNHKVFSSSDEVGGIMINDAPKGMERTSFIRMDPPEHDDQRREVSSTVNPITLAKMESLIRKRTNMVLDGLPRGETFNWVEHVSIELTSMMLATLFDYPIEDKAKLIRWSDTFICDINAPDAPVHSEEERFAEQMRFAEHMNEIWEERAKKPKSFDVISIMAHGEATSKMTLRQRMGILILFLVGGNDTTRNSMSGGLLGLSRFPDQFRKLRENPELVTSAVSEIVRWQTPVIHMRRTTLEDAEIGGKPIKAGDKVVVWYISGNRDEEHIERADEFIVDASGHASTCRSGRNPSLPGQPSGRAAIAGALGGGPAARPADRGGGQASLRVLEFFARDPFAAGKDRGVRGGRQAIETSPSPCGRGLGEGAHRTATPPPARGGGGPPCSAPTTAAASGPAPDPARPPDRRSRPRAGCLPPAARTRPSLPTWSMSQ
jgi:cytochrome P450